MGCGVVVGCAVVTGNVLDRAYTFIRGDVGEHDAADHVADRPHALSARAQVIVHDNAATLELDAGRLGAEAFGVSRAAHCEQHLVSADRTTLRAGREADLQAAICPGDPTDLPV